MNEYIIEELQKYVTELETNFHDMVEIEFTVENKKLYLLSSRVGKRNDLANLKIVISMFCEGKMDIEDVINKLRYQQLESILHTGLLVNASELKRLGSGLAASGGVGSATVCFSKDEAINQIAAREKFIYCRFEVSPEDIEVMCSKYCQGVMTSRGGMTSHAAVICRGMRLPCVVGFGDYNEMLSLLLAYGKNATIDGNNGEIYAGIGIISENNSDLPEINILYKLLQLIIKNNITIPKTAPLVWRLWDVIVLGKRYRGSNNTKRLVVNVSSEYRSFIQPSQEEIEIIYQDLRSVENGEIIIEDFIGFLVSQLSAQVQLGKHYLYMRPLLDPIKTMCVSKTECKRRGDSAGIQLTGLEFFHINQSVDFLIDIHSIKFFFTTEFYNVKEASEISDEYSPLNYLDYTNPYGESLIINTYNAKKISVYINDVLIPEGDLAMVYHLIRRRAYHWTWYKDNNVLRKEIIDYLSSNAFVEDTHTKMYYLCEEMHLIKDSFLTPSGISLLGR